MQPAHVTAFQDAILGGSWAQALHILPQLSPDPHALAQAKFLVLRQKYIEEIDAGSTVAALHTLRSELAPLHVQQAELRVLAGECCCCCSCQASLKLLHSCGHGTLAELDRQETVAY